MKGMSTNHIVWYYKTNNWILWYYELIGYLIFAVLGPVTENKDHPPDQSKAALDTDLRESSESEAAGEEAASFHFKSETCKPPPSLVLLQVP